MCGGFLLVIIIWVRHHRAGKMCTPDTENRRRQRLFLFVG